MNERDRELDDARENAAFVIAVRGARWLIEDAVNMSESEYFRERAEDNAYHAVVGLARAGLVFLSRNAYAMGTLITPDERQTIVDALRIAADDRDSEADYSTGDDADDLLAAADRYHSLANRLERIAK